MSFPLPNVDLSTAAVGSNGIISLQNVGISAGGVSANPSLYDKPATIFMFNDSGCGLRIIFSQTGAGINLPAGGWVPIPLPPGENKITWTVLYVLPNPPVSLLMLTYYQPGEAIPQSMTLGNSPVGIGGSVQTSSVQTLSNEGNASNTLVIDIGDVAFSQLFTLYTDGHALWKVDQSGVLHQVMKVQVSGNPLLLGQSGDQVEVLGSLQVDGTGAGITDLGPLAVSGIVTLTLGAIVPNNVAYQANNAAGTAKNVLRVDASNFTKLQSAGASLDEIRLTSTADALMAWFNTSGGGINAGTFQAPKVQLTTGSLTRISQFSGTGNGTFSHGLGVTPDIIIAVQNVLGSQTFGYSGLTSTQVVIATGAGQAWTALAIKL